MRHPNGSQTPLPQTGRPPITCSVSAPTKQRSAPKRRDDRRRKRRFEPRPEASEDGDFRLKRLFFAAESTKHRLQSILWHGTCVNEISLLGLSRTTNLLWPRFK